MKEMLDRLVHLQETDEKIVALQKEEEKIPREIEEQEQGFENSKGRLTQVQESLEELEGKFSQFSRELEEAKDQQRRSQARALAVKTQREYQAVQREGEFARKRRGELDGQVRELQEEKGILEESLLEAQQDLEGKEAALEEKRKQAEARMKAIRDEREDLQKTREVEAGLIEPELMGKYQRVFQRYRGKGLVRVTGGVCNGCFMMIPPQLYNQVLAHGGIHTCPNCGRIIYVDSE